MASEKTWKRNFEESEVEVLVGEVKARKDILFGGHSSGVTNIRKADEWQHVVTAVNSVSATERTVAEVKKKWSDLKVEAKRKMVCHHKSVSATVPVQLEAVGGEEIPGPASADNTAAEMAHPCTSVPRAHFAPGSGRVLTDAVLQTQRETITTVKEVRDELRQIRQVMSGMCGVLSDISTLLNKFVNK